MTEITQAIAENRRAWETLMEINNRIYEMLLEAYPIGTRVEYLRREYTVQDHHYAEDGGPGILLLQDPCGHQIFVDVNDGLPWKLGDK